MDGVDITMDSIRPVRMRFSASLGGWPDRGVPGSLEHRTIDRTKGQLAYSPWALP
nr:hypothetical protein [Kibdelosporangium sp. MJ126-NF4]CTQ96945.1 hypothetical protein [Kibdelosporangium sp. MJ126-NF4]